MKQSTKRFFSLIVAFVMVIAAFIIYFNLTQPAYQEIQSIKAKVKSRENFLQSQQDAISQVQKLISSYKGEGQFQDVISEVFPLNPDVAGALAQMTGLIQNNKIALQSIAVSLPVIQNISTPPQGQSGSNSFAATIVKPFGSIAFQIRLIGTYEDFKAFVKNLESNIRLFDVQKINFQPAGKPDQNLYSYDLTVTAYYQGH